MQVQSIVSTAQTATVFAGVSAGAEALSHYALGQQDADVYLAARRGAYGVLALAGLNAAGALPLKTTPTGSARVLIGSVALPLAGTLTQLALEGAFAPATLSALGVPATLRSILQVAVLIAPFYAAENIRVQDGRLAADAANASAAVGTLPPR